MLEQKRRLNVARDRLLAHIMAGGKIDEIDEESERNAPVIGIDCPVDVTRVDWLNRRQ